MKFSSAEECICARPESLTLERAESFLPQCGICKQWQRKNDEGTLPGGIRGMFGMICRVFPGSRPTIEEAEWMEALCQFGTWRWFGSVVLYDDNQITAVELLEVVASVLGREVGGIPSGDLGDCCCQGENAQA